MLLIGILLGAIAAVAILGWLATARRNQAGAAELIWNDVFRCEAIDSADADACASIWRRSADPALAEAS